MSGMTGGSENVLLISSTKGCVRVGRGGREETDGMNDPVGIAGIMGITSSG